MHRLRQLWITLISSLWFVPLTLVFGGIGLAVFLLWLDVEIGSNWTSRHTLLFGVGASGARGMLTAIASSMMTVASLTFSLTISTLATAASQYTSRLIRNFMRDRINQFVLGYFVGLFAYCLVVLRTIRGGDEGAFVPSLSVMGGLVLALISIVVLIVFIHHIAGSIQAGTILERVTKETLVAIETLFPQDVGDSVDEASQVGAVPIGMLPARWHPVTAGRFGYVESVDTETLLGIAAKLNTVIRMTADVGSFVTLNGVLCEISLPEAPDKTVCESMCGAYDIGVARTVEQDAAFGIRQIVDIALKALSPGINDTTTGVMAVEHLSVILEELAARDIADRLRGKDGKIRLIAAGRTFQALLHLSLDQIRRNAAGNPAVIVAIIGAISGAGRCTTNSNRRRVLTEQGRLLLDVADKSLDVLEDRDPIHKLALKTLEDLDSAPLGVLAAL